MVLLHPEAIVLPSPGLSAATAGILVLLKKSFVASFGDLCFRVVKPGRWVHKILLNAEGPLHLHFIHVDMTLSVSQHVENFKMLSFATQLGSDGFAIIGGDFNFLPAGERRVYFDGRQPRLEDDGLAAHWGRAPPAPHRAPPGPAYETRASPGQAPHCRPSRPLVHFVAPDGAPGPPAAGSHLWELAQNRAVERPCADLLLASSSFLRPAWACHDTAVGGAAPLVLVLSQAVARRVPRRTCCARTGLEHGQGMHACGGVPCQGRVVDHEG